MSTEAETRYLSLNLPVDSYFFALFLQPQSICTIEELSRVVVTREDDVTNSVSVFVLPDKLITFSMEDRDANEFAIVLAGYYRLIVGEFSTRAYEQLSIILIIFPRICA